jgi:hypothetical protein
MTDSEAIQAIIEAALLDKGVVSVDGRKGPIAQTGEDYSEFSIRSPRGHGSSALAVAVAGLVCAFAQDGWTCYWRMKADYYDAPGELPGVYVRFIISGKPELSEQELAA